MDLSIVIPTYNERDNVGRIASRIREALRAESYEFEIVFVDDSMDDTPTVLEQLACCCSEVRYIHRNDKKGLASAVVDGIAVSSGRYIVVMDADLQHPPELIPLIVKRLSTADVVIPSRFIVGGSDGGLNLFRKLVSWTARTIGRVAIRRMRNITDCTSGYFGLNRSVVQNIRLEPIGWKILMEVLVKGDYQTVHEIPYSFLAREAGHSKMGLQEHWNYLRHVMKLVLSSPEDCRFYTFCLVGTLGVFVNLFCLTILLTVFEAGKLSASVGASFIAMLHNFLWNNNVTWRQRQQRGLLGRAAQFPQFVLISGVSIMITALFARAFSMLDWNIYLGQLVGIFIATYWSFSANDTWTWSSSQPEKRPKLIVTQENASNLSWNRSLN